MCMEKLNYQFAKTDDVLRMSRETGRIEAYTLLNVVDRVMVDDSSLGY